MSDWGDFHSVSFQESGWNLFWCIPHNQAGGLEMWWADFMGRRVLWKGSQPFAIVPYHHPLDPVGASEPPEPQFTFKDGLGQRCRGAPFTALKYWAPNEDTRFSDDGQWTTQWNAGRDLQAVRIEAESETSFDPASLRISAKFQCGWYQYVQRWEFNSYGEIHAELGMGGELHPINAHKAHVHHMYFRIDLDIDGWSSDVFEIFTHHGFDDDALADEWQVQSGQDKHPLDPNTSRKFRIRDLFSTVGDGVVPRGYEIEIPAQAGTDNQSTADIWATVYRGDHVEQGEEVGASGNCDDRELAEIATGPLDTTDGSDIVAWIVVRHHHEPRDKTEEKSFLPYHYQGFHITPRAFEIFKPSDRDLNPEKPPSEEENVPFE